jgi:hypothetical protein
MSTIAMESQPLKRVYFDTNALYRWPNSANNLMLPFGVANWLKTELYFPKAVEDELEGQFVRSVKRLCENVNSNIKELEKICRNVAEVPIEKPNPSDEQLRTLFRERSNQLKEFYGISTLPNTLATTDSFLSMAINRRVPFEECSIGKDETVVVGFQDAVIFFSIIEHVRTAKDGERSALVTNDGIFYGGPMQALLKEQHVSLEMFKPGTPIFDELWKYVWEAIREEWNRENAAVERELEGNKESLAKQLLPILTPDGLGRSAWKTVKIIKSLKIDKFQFVKADLPESEYRPPSAPTYQRPEGSDVKISARAAVDIEATIQSYSGLWGIFLAQQNQPWPEEPEPKFEEMTLREMLNLSITGTFRGGRIGNFRISDVQIDK